jgi:hypothetical protein
VDAAPPILDAHGLVALWREALLAREVLRGRTIGYRRHPQLERFRACDSPRSAINRCPMSVHDEAEARGYRFDQSKLGRVATEEHIVASDGQLSYEWSWLMGRLRHRNDAIYRRQLTVGKPLAHPFFHVVMGPIAHWEHVQ